MFVPSAFLSGISGQFFRQFAVTISASTLISCFVSLTLSPALCAVLFKAHDPNHKVQSSPIVRLIKAGFDRFNFGFPMAVDQLWTTDAPACAGNGRGASGLCSC